MRKTMAGYAALGALLLTAAVAAFAHHGTSVSYVKDDKGAMVHWAAELLPTPIMMRNMKMGWTKDSLKPGDQMTLVCNPSKVASATVCLARKLTVNGKEMQLGNAAPGNETKQ